MNALCTLMVLTMAAADDYARAELLAEPGPLTNAIVLDARPRAKYDAGHVPGARWVDAAEWARAFGDGGDAPGWSERIGKLGIAADSQVVVYDEGVKDAARVWWILRYWGIEQARLLNGGWPGWVAAGQATSREAPAVRPTGFAAAPQKTRLATKRQLLDTLGKLQVVDARSAGEFCGTEKLSNKRAGAIPGAKHLDWVELLEPQTGRFKSAGELAKLFAAAGIEVGRPTAAHCQSGGRAAVMAFALELMGADDVSNYYASWGEWGNSDDTPIEPGSIKQ